MNNQVDAKQYYDKMHRLGRWMTFITLIVFFGVPFVVCLRFDIMPTVGQVMAASSALLILLLPSSLAELVSETPILGSSYYLCCITGNVINMKLPSAINAQKIADVQKGTDVADAVAGVAVAVSSLMTMVILAAGVLLLTPLKPFLESEFVATGTSYVLPALYGYLSLSMINKNAGGGITVHGIPKTLIIPAIIAVVLCLFVIPESYSTWQGFIVIAFIPLMYFLTKAMYKKGIVHVDMPETAEAAALEGSEE